MPMYSSNAETDEPPPSANVGDHCWSLPRGNCDHVGDVDGDHASTTLLFLRASPLNVKDDFEDMSKGPGSRNLVLRRPEVFCSVVRSDAKYCTLRRRRPARNPPTSNTNALATNTAHIGSELAVLCFSPSSGLPLPSLLVTFNVVVGVRVVVDACVVVAVVSVVVEVDAGVATVVDGGVDEVIVLDIVCVVRVVRIVVVVVVVIVAVKVVAGMWHAPHMRGQSSFRNVLPVHMCLLSS